MRKSSRVLQCLAVVMIIVGLAACAGIGGQTDTSPTPTEVLVTPLNQPGRVNADVVPVRSGPGVEYEQVGVLSRNRDLTVVGRSGDGKWYKVELPDYSGDQPSFWVAADFVTLIFSTETVPITVIVSTLPLTLTETITTQVLSPSPSATLKFPTSSFASLTNTLIPHQPPTRSATASLEPTVTLTFTATTTLIAPPTPTPTTTLIPPQTATFTATTTLIPPPTPTFTYTVVVSPAATTPAGTP